jgi:flagellar basal-body rod protein FlgB
MVREGLAMFNSLLNNSTLPALEQTVLFAHQRHQLLAGNLANIDTPDYKTRDVSVDEFRTQLKAAVQGTPADRTTYVPGKGFEPISKQQAIEQVRDVSKQILFHDGSDVSLEQQVTEIAKNQNMHNTAIALMRSQFQTLQVAIRESASA